jgi:hypothetical protein
MIHIRQKLDFTNKVGELFAYSVVYTADWVLPLEQHPSIVNNPELFEIVDEEIPQHAQTLIYQS